MKNTVIGEKYEKFVGYRTAICSPEL